MSEFDNYLNTTRDKIISLIEYRQKRKIPKIFDTFLRTLKTVQQEPVKRKFYDWIGELIGSYPTLLTGKTYKLFIKSVNKHLPWIERVELEKYIIQKYCFYEEEFFIMGFDGMLTMVNIFDKKNKMRIKGRGYLTNYRIILHGPLSYAVRFSLWYGWAGYLLDRAKVKWAFSDIIKKSEKKSNFGFSWPFIGALALKRIKNSLSYNYKLGSERKDIFKFVYTLSNDKISYILEKFILINNDLSQNPYLICPSCEGERSKKRIFCVHCGEKTDLGEHYSLIEQGFSFASDEKYEEAIKCIDDADVVLEEYYKSWLDKGLNLLKKEKYEEAVQKFDVGIKVNRQNFKLLETYWFYKGKALSLLNSHEEAIECYNKSLFTYETHLNKGLSLAELGKYKLALRSYDRALSYKPNDYLTLVNKGNAFLNLKKDKKAINCYNKAIKSNPDDPIAWIKKAEAFKNLGKREQMVECAEIALKIEPNNAIAQNMLKI